MGDQPPDEPAPPPTTAERRRRVVVAGHRGDTGTSRSALDDDAPGVRASALSALARCDALTPEELDAGIHDHDPTVRRRAAEIAATGALPTASIDLLPLLDDPDDRVVEVAAWAIGELAPTPEGAVARLGVLCRDHADSLVREAAVAALGAIGDPASLPVILAATTDKATVRRRAVIALAPYDGPEVDEALERARQDRDWQVRQAAEDLLAPPPPED